MEWRPLTNASEIIQLDYEDEIVRKSIEELKRDWEEPLINLNIFNTNIQSGPLKGGNPFSRFTIANIYRGLTGEDIIPINLKLTWLASNKNLLTDSDTTNEDLGLVIYPNKGVHPYLWDDLREQVSSNFKDVKLDIPFVITGLVDVFKDNRLEYNLGIRLNKLTEVYNSPILNGDGGKFNLGDEGLIKEGFPYNLNSDGKLSLLVRKTHDGVCRLYRSGFNLNAEDSFLAYSNNNNRIHLVKFFH